MNWFILSIIALVSYGINCFLIILLKKSDKKYNALLITLLYYIIVVICSVLLLIHSIIKKSNNKILKTYYHDIKALLKNKDMTLIACIITSISFITANYCFYTAYKYADNATFVELIGSLNVIVVLVGSIIIFKKDYHTKNILGILLSLLGLYLITKKKSINHLRIH